MHRLQGKMKEEQSSQPALQAAVSRRISSGGPRRRRRRKSSGIAASQSLPVGLCAARGSGLRGFRGFQLPRKSRCPVSDLGSARPPPPSPLQTEPGTKLPGRTGPEAAARAGRALQAAPPRAQGSGEAAIGRDGRAQMHDPERPGQRPRRSGFAEAGSEPGFPATPRGPRTGARAIDRSGSQRRPPTPRRWRWPRRGGGGPPRRRGEEAPPPAASPFPARPPRPPCKQPRPRGPGGAGAVAPVEPPGPLPREPPPERPPSAPAPGPRCRRDWRSAQGGVGAALGREEGEG